MDQLPLKTSSGAEAYLQPLTERLHGRMWVFLFELSPFSSLDSYAPQACEILFNPLNKVLQGTQRLREIRTQMIIFPSPTW